MSYIEEPNWELLSQCMQTLAENCEGTFMIVVNTAENGDLDFYLDHDFNSDDALWCIVGLMETWCDKVRLEHG